jgi:hypothetical protein
VVVVDSPTNTTRTAAYAAVEVIMPFFSASLIIQARIKATVATSYEKRSSEELSASCSIERHNEHRCDDGKYSGDCCRRSGNKLILDGFSLLDLDESLNSIDFQEYYTRLTK